MCVEVIFLLAHRPTWRPHLMIFSVLVIVSLWSLMRRSWCSLFIVLLGLLLEQLVMILFVMVVDGPDTSRENVLIGRLCSSTKKPEDMKPVMMMMNHLFLLMWHVMLFLLALLSLWCLRVLFL